MVFRRTSWGQGAHRCAFTLIELLVAIAIVVLLIGVLLPALGAARRVGKDTACLSNLRQALVAMEAYAHDHAGRYVPASTLGESNPDGTIKRREWRWYEPLEENGYLAAELRQCPLVDQALWGTLEDGTLKPNVSYGINTHIELPNWRTVWRPKSPSSLIVLGDKPFGGKDELQSEDGIELLDAGGTYLWADLVQHDPQRTRRHAGGETGHVVMADGHAEALDHTGWLKDSGAWYEGTHPFVTAMMSTVCCPPMPE